MSKTEAAAEQHRGSWSQVRCKSDPYDLDEQMRMGWSPLCNISRSGSICFVHVLSCSEPHCSALAGMSALPKVWCCTGWAHACLVTAPLLVLHGWCLPRSREPSGCPVLLVRAWQACCLCPLQLMPRRAEGRRAAAHESVALSGAHDIATTLQGDHYDPA